MWLMLQQDEPDDYVIATGEQHSVREFIEVAGAELGFGIEWRGEGIDEVGIDADTGRILVEVDARYFRPTEVDTLLGDPARAKARLGWSPRVSFRELVKEMVAADHESAKRDAHLTVGGYQTYGYEE
jgi:GDPmannose 4,6-dehydratase